MSDNVIVLGAGSSFDAEIPLSSRFVEKMREYAFTGKSDEGPLSDLDKKIFEKAMKVMRALYNYHGGANFDDRNIEDILSVLSFNIIGRTPTEKDSLNSMIRAIARTIELSCKVKHEGALDKIYPNPGNSIYKSFWAGLFQRFSGSQNFPPIVTFNYDLVLERALFQLLISVGEWKLPFNEIILRYHYKHNADLCYKIKKVNFTLYTDENPFGKEPGTILERCEEKEITKPINIEILKLHGSLNFSRKKWVGKEEYQPPTNLVTEPFIIPPISNKSISEDAEEIWKTALNSLREAKNIVIVGYSLPPTDVYVQYFLKTALGPNMDLTRITVFNPDLFKNTDANEKMRERYSNCFSQQVMKRIINFDPQTDRPKTRPTKIEDLEKYMGTFEHFVSEINTPNNGLFF